MSLAAPVVALLLAVATAGPSPRAAAADAPSASARLSAQARAAYDDVRLRDAAVLFREAADAASSDDERATALLWAGVAAGQAGELAIARRAFDDALRVRCAGALPTTVSPKVQSVFAEAVTARWPGGCPPEPPPVAPAASTTSTTQTEPIPPTITPTPPTTAATSTGPPATTTPASSSGTMSPLGLGLVGVGGVAVGVAGGVALKGVADIATAADARTPQVDARARLDDGNLALGVAAVTTLVGAGALVAGIVLLGGAE